MSGAEEYGPGEMEAAAEAAGLRYIRDEDPGITRRRHGRGFSYKDPQGRTIKETGRRKRLEALAIPPAWTDVWICPDPDGHILATGRDDKGRKQYIYHPRWRDIRNEQKYDRLLEFGRSLPRIRARVEADLGARGLTRDKVLAVVVRLLESTCIRVGNEEYRRRNESFGITTLRDRHVEISGSRIRLSFDGKGGKRLDVDVSDRRLARIVRECRDVPGYELFQFYDGDGERRPIGSGDVNEYLRDTTGRAFTAKDFRTWMGTLHALAALWEAGPTDEEAEAEKRIVAAIDYVADQLQNTRSVCREFYVHPGVVDAYRDGWLVEFFGDDFPGEASEGLSREETALVKLLDRLGAAGSPTG